jgi:hypothetical protein
MQLPRWFPHTRHEQYLVALPDELRSDEELLRAIAVLRRLHRCYDQRILRHIVELRALGCSEDEILRVLTPGPAAESREQRWHRGPLARR